MSQLARNVAGHKATVRKNARDFGLYRTDKGPMDLVHLSLTMEHDDLNVGGGETAFFKVSLVSTSTDEKWSLSMLAIYRVHASCPFLSGKGTLFPSSASTWITRPSA